MYMYTCTNVHVHMYNNDIRLIFSYMKKQPIAHYTTEEAW